MGSIERMKHVQRIYKNFEMILCTLYSDMYYKKKIKNFSHIISDVARKFNEQGVEFVSATTRPFSFKYKMMDGTLYALKVTNTKYDCIQYIPD